MEFVGKSGSDEWVVLTDEEDFADLTPTVEMKLHKQVLQAGGPQRASNSEARCGSN
jgi:hypothetical protein